MAHKTGWYTIGEKQTSFPKGHGPCSICRRALKPFDVVYVKRVSVPQGSYNRNGWSQDFYFLMHKGCIVRLMEKAPPDVLNTWEEIRERVAAGGGLFEDG